MITEYLTFPIKLGQLGAFKTSNSDTTLKLSAAAALSQSLELDEDDLRHTADVDASFFFRNSAGRYSQVTISCTYFVDGTV